MLSVKVKPVFHYSHFFYVLENKQIHGLLIVFLTPSLTIQYQVTCILNLNILMHYHVHMLREISCTRLSTAKLSLLVLFISFVVYFTPINYTVC